MHDPGFHTVRPVIRQDLVVALIFKGDGADEVESRPGIGGGSREGCPFQAFEHDVVWDGAVGGLDVAGPFEVAAEVGGFAFEEMEVIACWASTLLIQIQLVSLNGVVVVDGGDGGGGAVPMMSLRSSHVCRWNSSSVEASTARSTAVRLNGSGSSEAPCEMTILADGLVNWDVVVKDSGLESRCKRPSRIDPSSWRRGG